MWNRIKSEQSDDSDAEASVSSRSSGSSRSLVSSRSSLSSRYSASSRSSGSESGSEEEYESVLPKRSNSCSLAFDPKSIEKVILQISDQFDFRVVMNDERAKQGILITTGLTIAGGLLGRHYGGKVGAAVGGAIGGACGIGIVVISMRNVWNDIKDKMFGVFEIVYDYLAGMGLEDYKRAGVFLAKHGCNVQLAKLILNSASGILGKKILSSLTPA